MNNRRRLLSYAVASGFALLLVACEPPASETPPAQPPDNPTTPTPIQAPTSFAEPVEEIRPAVVNIYTRTRAPATRPRPFSPGDQVPRERVEQSLGSGFIFDASGLVLTNDHVVGEATEIAVRLLDERIFSAEVVGRDPQTDVAVLQLQEVQEELPAVKFGDSDALRVGDWILAMGNPLGLTSTVTAGIVSASGRQVLPPGGARLRYQDFIQTDASINPGSSGGPMVSTSGEVIGIITAVSPAGQGLGFAIPINMVREILTTLIEEGRVERSWMGIYIGEISPVLRQELDLDVGGALVTRVVEDGPADDAGVVRGDIIVEIDGEEVTDSSRLSWIAANLGVGAEVEVVVLRAGQRLELPLVMGALPD